MEGSALDELGRDLTRVADRLRSSSDVRLAQPAEGGTRAEAALDLAQRLADAAQGIEERHSDVHPRWRVVPDLGVFAVGDQVAVTGHDLLAALTAAVDLGPGAPVWTRDGRCDVEQLLADVAEAVRSLRLAL